MRPRDELEVAEVMRSSAGPCHVHGGGTRRIVPVEGQAIDTSALTGVRIYEPGSLTLVAGAGTPVAEVEAVLADQRQRLAFEAPDLRALLGRQGVSTLGGVAAANASGPRRIQVGAARDQVLGLRFVTGDGVVVKAGGRVMKNVTGLDLSKLLVGSHGSLGVITELAFRVQAMPEATATLVGSRDLVSGLAALRAALGSPMDVSGAAYLNGRAMIRIEGMAGSVAYRAEALQAQLGGDWDIVDAADWTAVRDVMPFAGRDGNVWRISVKPTDAVPVVQGLEAEAIFDWGGGLIWVLASSDLDLRAHLGNRGHATLMRGQGMTFHPEVPAVAALTAGLKGRFDPKGILR
ncbi:MAG: FAD-binding protein [Pseudorhodobacter sp.]|nr:FAD-binding protein [Pseudorhodobacter sp.]